jgi:DNA excision repair protein ERCC-5
VEDVVAKRFAEFQKIFAEKRKAFRAENFEVQEEAPQTRETSRAHSPGLEYADSKEAKVAGIKEREEEVVEVGSSPPPHSDEDEDMEEVEIAVPPPSIAPRVSRPTGDPGPSLRSPEPSASTLAEIPALNPVQGSEDEEDIPISDWSRSPSPQPRPPDREEVLSASVLTLDRSRGLLDPDDSFDQGPPAEQDQEHEDFDAAREMDPDAEAGEFARWMSQVKGRNLEDVRKEIEQEISSLRKEQKAAMRDSEDVTGQMIAQIMVSLRHSSGPRSSKLIMLNLEFVFAPVDDVAVVRNTVHHCSHGS